MIGNVVIIANRGLLKNRYTMGIQDMSLFNYNTMWLHYINNQPAHKKSMITDFLTSLKSYKKELVFNPWGDFDEQLECDNSSPSIRCNNLLAYLLPRLGRAKIFIVAEAVGYQGGRFSGIAITCERMLLGKHKTIKSSDVAEVPLLRTSSPVSPLLKRTQQELGFNEPTDTVVWNAIVELGVNPYDTLLWNIFPFHPYKSGAPLTNRTPTEEEQRIGYEYTKQLLDIHRQLGGPDPLVLAVGQKSAQTLERFGLPAIGLRHPANGGANLYREGFKGALENYGGQDL